MPLVGFKNIFEEKVEYIELQEKNLLAAVLEFSLLKQNRNIRDTLIEEKITIRVNKTTIPPDAWKSYTLNKLDLVTITPTLHGDNSGGFLQILVGMAMIIVAGIATMGAGAAFVGPMMATWSGWGAVAALGVSIVLGGISSLLFKTDLPKLTTDTRKDSQTYSWSGITTSARYDSPVPVVYGTHAVGGNLISAFTQAAGTDSYLYMLVALSEGEISGVCQEDNIASVCQTTAPTNTSYREPRIRINDQPFRSYDGIEWWYRSGKNSGDSSYNEFYPYVQNKIPSFDGVRLEMSDGREVISTDDLTYSTTKAVDAVLLQFNAPALFTMDQETGGISQKSVFYTVTYTPSSGGVPTSVLASEWQAVASPLNGINSPPADTYLNSYNVEIVECKDYGTIFSTSPYMYGAKPDGTYTVTIDAIEPLKGVILDPYTNVPQFDYEQEQSLENGVYPTLRYKIHYTVKNDTNGVTESKSVINHKNLLLSPKVYSESQENFTPGYTIESEQHIKTTDVIGNYLLSFGSDVLKTPSSGYIWMGSGSGEGRIRAGDKFRLKPVWTGRTTSEIAMYGESRGSIWSSLRIRFPIIDRYDIKIRRTDGGPSKSYYTQDSLNLYSVTELIDGNFIYPNTALLGLKIRATGQLSGGIPDVVTVIQGTKVSVPRLKNSLNEAVATPFEDYYWNNSRWEDISGVDINKTWNNASFTATTQFSDNSMLCVRDFVLNTRYGVGNFINSDDMYSSGISSAIKECHKKYNPYPSGVPDLLAWWNYTENEIKLQTTDNIEIDAVGINKTVTYDETNRYITFADVDYVLMRVKLTSSMKNDKNVTFTAYITNPTLSIDMEVAYKSSVDDNYMVGGSSLDITTTGSYPISFITKRYVDIIEVKFRRHNHESHAVFGFRLDDIAFIDTIADDLHNHTFDGVMESEQGALTALSEMCDSFRCWPVWQSGKFDFIIDKDDTPTQLIDDGNIYNFKQSFTPISEIPYKIEGQFTNAGMDYEMFSVIGYANNTALRKTNVRTVGLKGIVDRWRAEREVTYKMNAAINRTHIVSGKCGLDMMHSTAGDVIYIQNNLPQWGAGGRILSASCTEAPKSTITIDRRYHVDRSVASYCIKYVTASNLLVSATVALGAYSVAASIQTASLRSWVGTPATDSHYTIGIGGTDPKKFRLVAVNRTMDDDVEFVAMEHVASIYTATSIKTVLDTSSKLPNPLKKPDKPVNIKVSPAAQVDGMGFFIEALSPPDAMNVKEIVVKMGKAQTGETASDNMETIGYINPREGKLLYLNNNLDIQSPYVFELFCRTYTNIDGYKARVAFSATLSAYYSGPPPTGLRVKQGNAAQYNGKNVEIVWNSASSDKTAVPVTGYRIDVYFMLDEELGSVVRSEYTSSTEYIYTMEKNIQDAIKYKKQTYPWSKLKFRIRTITYGKIESTVGAVIYVQNSTPATITALTPEPQEDAALFKWNPIDERDIRVYKYRTSVCPPLGPVSASSDWKESEETEFRRELTNTEIGQQKAGKSSIYSDIKATDWYENESIITSMEASTLNYKADYIVSPTPGLGHFTTIADAVNAIPSTGGRITLKDGKHDISTAIAFPNYPINIFGTSRDGTIVRNTAGNMMFTAQDNTTSYSFSNFTASSMNVSVYNKMFYFYESVGINSANVDISNVKLLLADNGIHDGSGDTGISTFRGTDALYVKDCYIDGGKIGVSANSVKTFITNNIITDCIGTNISVFSYAGENTFINDNIITDVWNIGISCLANVENLSVSRNKIKAKNDSLSSEYIYGMVIIGTYGNISDNTVFIENTRTGNSLTRGISVETHAGNSTNLTFSKNTININVNNEGETEGMYLEDASDCIISENNIKISNTDSTNLHAGIYTIEMSYDGDRNNILGNTIDMVNSGSADYGIYIAYNDDCSITNNNILNVLSGHQVVNSGSGNIINGNTESGINMAESDGSRTRAFINMA